MKNTIKVFGIIAFVAVIGFSMLGCDLAQDYTFYFKIINLTNLDSEGNSYTGSVIDKVTIDGDENIVNIDLGGEQTFTVHKSLTQEEYNWYLFPITVHFKTPITTKYGQHVNSIDHDTACLNNKTRELYAVNGVEATFLLDDPR